MIAAEAMMRLGRPLDQRDVTNVRMIISDTLQVEGADPSVLDEVLSRKTPAYVAIVVASKMRQILYDNPKVSDEVFDELRRLHQMVDLAGCRPATFEGLDVPGPVEAPKAMATAEHDMVIAEAGHTLCIYHQDIAGRYPARPCGGPMYQHMWHHSTDYGRTDFYVCADHSPQGALQIYLPDNHPLVVWDRIRGTVRGRRHDERSSRYLRIQAAERATHGLPDDCASIEIRGAEGLDARIHYRWALPYVRAYAEALDTQSADVADVDVAALQFLAADNPEPDLLADVFAPVQLTLDDLLADAFGVTA